MIHKDLDMDEKDVRIINQYMKNPMVSQSEIAEKLALSQPSVFMRVQKLKKRGLLDQQMGINYNKAKLFLSRVDFTCKNPNKVLEELKKCPFFVNGFIISGENNVSVMLVHKDLKKIDDVVSNHIRSKDSVSNIRMNLIVSAAKDYILQMDLEHEINPRETCSEVGGCGSCSRIHIDDS